MKKLLFVCNTLLQPLTMIINTIEQAIKGGIHALQMRHKGDFNEEDIALASHLYRLCREANVFFVLNDRPDIAIQIGCYAVHLGQTDMPLPMARGSLGTDCIIGTTVSTIEEAVRAEAQGADYVSFGHIYPTTTKIKTYPPIGTQVLVDAKKSLKGPIWAIGGINLHTIASVLSTGITGIAVSSAIQKAPDVYIATKRLREVCDAY